MSQSRVIDWASVVLVGLPIAACESTSLAPSTDAGNPAVAANAISSDQSLAAVAVLAKQLGVSSDELTVIASAIGHYSYVGANPALFKIADRKGNWYEVALDERSQLVDVVDLTKQDLELRRQKYGALDESVVDQMLLGTDDKLKVLVWLSEDPSPTAERPDATKAELSPKDVDALYAAVDTQRAATLKRIVPPMLERIRAFDSEAWADGLSPSIVATLTVDALLELAKDEAIDRIYYRAPASAELDMAKAATGVPVLHAAGITGAGVRVALTEAGGAVAEPNSLFLGRFIQDNSGVCGPPGDHATAVAGVLKERRINLFGTIYGETGVTPDVDLRVGGSCSTDDGQLQSASSRAATWGARAINLSWGVDTGQVLRGNDRFYDDMVLNRFRTVVKSAGNRAKLPWCLPNDGVLTSPGLAYNVITVGGFNDANTPTWSDDTMYDCSSSANPLSIHGDRQKPELVAPAVDLMLVTNGPANLASFTGTSGAAPHVTGVAALLIQKRPMLSVWPEIIRALLMATARNIEGASPLSDLDGAGALVASAAASLVDDSSRWGGTGYGCTSSTPTTLNLGTISASPRTRHRAVLSWDSDPSLRGYENMPSVDIDLAVVDGTGRTVATSASWDNTNEVVEFDSWWGGTYTLQAKKFRCDAHTWLGWAWSTTPIGKF